MTKLEIAKTLLPLVNKAQKKGLCVDLQFDSIYVAVLHFEGEIGNRKLTFICRIFDNEPETHEYKYLDIINYLKSI